MSNNKLNQAIISTVAYFSVFDYPLTAVEIWKFLYYPSTEGAMPESRLQLGNIIDVLKSERLNNIIEAKNGFYFLKGKEETVRVRLERYQLAKLKYKLALKTIRWLRWLAFVEMVAVCNNLGYNNTPADGDIDFFIITKKNRLWWTRLVVTLMVSLLGIRRYGQKITNRICLSFYITDDHLDLAGITLKPQDPYLVYWLATLAPIYNQEMYQKFIAANSWLKDYLPNFYSVILTNRRTVKDNQWITFSKNFDKLILGGLVGNWLEKLAKLVQLKKMKRNTASVASQPDTRVVISDSMLKFHETDKRQQYYQQWQAQISKILNNV